MQQEDAAIMQQEDDDLALAARKAELLAIFNSSVIAEEEKCVEDKQSEGCAVLESALESNISMQNGQHQEQDIHPMNLDSIVGESLIDPMNGSQTVCAISNIESGNTDAAPMSSAVKRSVENDNYSTPLLALRLDEEFKKPEGNFTKGCKWSPDGSCLLVGSDDKMLRLFNLPSQVSCGDIQDESWFVNESPKHIKPALTMKEGECIYDYAWYPAMHSSNIDSCCFAVACRDFPVHLWDAWHGNLICSYQPYDHLDQLVAPNSVNFNLDGSKIFCGFNRSIRVFRTCRPGRHFEKIDAKEQPGIISCFSFNPALPSVFVAGSYLGNLGLYSTDRNCLFCRIDGCPGGITQIQFSSDGTKLFSGARMNNELMCWDLRNPGEMLWSFRREVNTNQRIAFDLEPQTNKYIVSGSTSGTVLKWDLQDLGASDGKNPIKVKPSSTFVAHNDCCNGVSINPHFPVLATSSGQRHFLEPQSISDAESSAEEDDRPLFVRGNSIRENSVKLWWIGGQ